MNSNRQTSSGEETRTLTALCAEQYSKLVALLAQAKQSLITEFKENFEIQDRLLHLAVNEAEALAWETDFPHLFFPTLAVEKVRVVADWHERQRIVRTSSPGFAFAA